MSSGSPLALILQSLFAMTIWLSPTFANIDYHQHENIINPTTINIFIHIFFGLMFTNIISWRLRRNWGYQRKFLVDYLVPFSNCFGDFKRLAACKKSADCGMLSWCQQVECCSCLKTLKLQDWTIRTTTTTNKQQQRKQQQQMECGSCLKTLKLYLRTLATHLYTPWQLPLLWILLAKIWQQILPAPDTYFSFCQCWFQLTNNVLL